jgi:adenine-specific DNA glycosylase
LHSRVTNIRELQKLPVIHHSFTHFDLQLHPYWIANATPHSQVADEITYCWYDVDQPARIGLAKPVLDIFNYMKLYNNRTGVVV